ncbi:hypothetical protein [Leptospira sp. 'Mane']|uniref:hypothetical protein n=1 Tax=Leptospira sp. 'Mane' TaxID=3387407 RepID=UPI00398A9A74
MIIQITNRKDVSEEICECCDSWMAHWENNYGEDTENCSVNFCKNKAEVGAHVGIVDDEFEDIYIIPLCKSHNSSEDIMMVEDRLIPAYELDDCDIAPED